MTVILLLLGILLVQGGAAQVSALFDLHWSTLASGGGIRQSASYGIQDISGLMAVGVSSSTNVVVAGGFFGPEEATFSIDLPLLSR